VKTAGTVHVVVMSETVTGGKLTAYADNSYYPTTPKEHDMTTTTIGLNTTRADERGHATGKKQTSTPDFMLPGFTADDCLCDVDYHCDRHDRDAEIRWWGARYRSEPAADESLAHDRDNYKHPEWAAQIV
jgi:hypothetical protein